MVTLIDTSVLIATERGRLDLDRLIAGHGNEEVAIAAITASELLHGVERAARPEHRTRREAFVESWLVWWPVVPFDLTAARVHARLWAQLAAKGTLVGAHDLIIAATAIAIGARVATRDERSFPRIPGLSLVKW
ncbi:MAG: PIN domain-containing protein [Acidobacteriota bacterium]